jgi:hypothetical protein
MKNWRNLAGVSLLVLCPMVPAQAATRAEPDRLTPPDAEVVATVNVRKMLQTPVVKKHALDPLQLLLKRNEELRQLLSAAGVDPLKDIDTIGLSSSGSGKTAKALVVVRGRFDPDKARTAADNYAKKHPDHLKSSTEGELPIWEIKASSDKPLFAAFAGKDALVMTASKDDTIATIKRAGQKSEEINKNMRAALDHLKGDENIWLAMAATDAIKKSLKADDNAKNFAEALQSITGALELTDDAQLAVVIHTNDAKAAEQIKGKLDELMPLLGFLGPGKDAGGRLLKEVIQNIKLAAEKNDVSIRLKLTDAQIEKVRK